MRRRSGFFESLEDRRMLAAFDVITAGDGGSGTCSPAQCTLRDAINAANDLAGADEIRITASLVGAINLNPTDGALLVSDPVSIIRLGDNPLTILADTSMGEGRVLDVTLTGGDVSIEGLTLSGGRVPSDAGGAIRFLSTGTLSIINSTVSGNTAANGGGVYSGGNGHVEITNSSISGNTALYGAGGGIQNVRGNITVSSSVIDGNQALNSGGGILNRYGAITLTDTDVTGNEVTYPGYPGGGIASGEGNLTISGSTISGNTSAGDGGGIYNYAGPVVITDSTISGNDASYGGGGILNETGTVTIDRSSLNNNRALYGIGGGIATDLGSVTLTRSSMRLNQSVDDGGGIATIRGDVTIFRSTLSGNHANDDGGGVSSIYATVSLENTTISGNTADSEGGGVHSENATIRILNSTVTLNQATESGGGIGLVANGLGESLVLVNTIVAGNMAATGPDFIAPADAVSDLQVLHSLVGDNQGTGLAASGIIDGTPQPDPQGNLIGGSPHGIIDPRLEPLAFNGGDTPTHALMIDSLAINRGRSDFLSPDIFDADGDGDTSEPLPLDQRGAARVTAAELDIGSFELPPAAVVSWNPPADIVFGTALGAGQLNASAEVSGTFQYTPPAGTVLNIGNGQVLTAVFTPDDLVTFRRTSVSTQINVTANLDFGDAPGRYPVTLVNNGARHVAGSLRLGSDVDGEADGQPDEFAEGDGADDDGITFLADLVSNASQPNTSSFRAVASAIGQLDAWIDFNGDGDWADAGEQIVSSITLLPGGNTISYTVPAGAKAGDTAARFRLSTDGALLPTGSASDGEVEDYLVRVLDGSVTPDVTVRLPQQRAAIRADQGRLVVSEGPIDLLGVARSDINQLQVIGGPSDDTITVDLSQEDPRDQLQLDAMGGSNSLAIVGSGATIDFTTGGGTDASHFDQIDISGSGAQLVVIDSTAVNKLSPLNLTVSIVGGGGDAVDFSDLVEWRVVEPRIIDGRFLRVVHHATGSQFVQLDLPNPWQNPLEPSDVNADGTVTAGDALRVINELGRRAYSDQDTKLLHDPLATTPWPGVYFDQSGDGRSTALDALRVINQLARIAIGGGEESEQLPTESGLSYAIDQPGVAGIDHDRTSSHDESQKLKSPPSLAAVLDTISWPTASSDPPEFTTPAAAQISARRVDELLSSEWSLGDLVRAPKLLEAGGFDEALD